MWLAGYHASYNNGSTMLDIDKFIKETSQIAQALLVQQEALPHEDPAEQLEGERQSYEHHQDARLGRPAARAPPGSARCGLRCARR